MTGPLVPAVRAGYCGRLAPSPTGWLHAGHARTFWVAWSRARRFGGQVVLRNDDLDRSRCRREFVDGFIEDLRWLGLDWDEGPDVGGRAGPYSQSGRIAIYRSVFEWLRDAGRVYPCGCSRQDVLRALAAPHRGEDEPVYPGTCRGRREMGDGRLTSWRFRVADGERVEFEDGGCGRQRFSGGRDFGDFVVWRDGLPSYQLACAVDDALMGMTEVVRGRDLLSSTARQMLLLRALGWPVPAYYHCDLVCDESGQRLAKRSDSMSLRSLRARGVRPGDWVRLWEAGGGVEEGELDGTRAPGGNAAR